MSKLKKKEQATTPDDLEPEKVAKTTKSSAAVYTYVGGGEDSPRVIEFMGGLQRFFRGQATEVTDAQVLAKLKTHPCFVEGKIDPEELHKYDETSKKEADEQRDKDKEKNMLYIKRHGKE